MKGHEQLTATAEQYLAAERLADTKSEYFDGEVFAMAGATATQVLIATNSAGELRRALKERDCRVYSADLRVHVQATGSYAYPDVVVVCGKAEFVDQTLDTLLNPKLIVEVLSPSTADWDRSGKFEHYRAIGSLTEYLVVAQDRIHIEHWVRQGDSTWIFSETNRVEDTLLLSSLGLQIACADLYDKVEFSTPVDSE